MTKKRAKASLSESLADVFKIKHQRFMEQKSRLKDLENAQKRDIPIQYITLIKQYDDGSDEEIYISLDPMLQIFSYLTPFELMLKVGLVCKSWYFLSLRTNFLWQNLYNKEFGDETSQPVNDTINEEDDSEFDGHWKKVFGLRIDLRNKWYSAHPDRVGYLDILESEYSRNKTRNPNKRELFKRDSHLACISEDDIVKEEPEKKLYRVDPSDRGAISKMCLVGSDRLLSGDQRGVIKLFNLRTFQQVRKFVGGHNAVIKDILVITPEQLATGAENVLVTKSIFKLDPSHSYFLSNELYSATINVWDLESGLLIKRFRGEDPIEPVNDSEKPTRFRYPLVKMQVYQVQSGENVLIVASQKTIEIYNLNTLKLIQSIQPFKKPTTVKPSKKLIDTAIERLNGNDSDDEEEEDDAMNDDEDPNMFNPNQKSIISFDMLDDHTIAFVTGDCNIHIYNLNARVCIKKMDMKKCKILDVENYNRPTSLEGFSKVYHKYAANSNISITEICKCKTNSNQFSVNLSIMPEPGVYDKPPKTYIKYFDYRFGSENPTKSIRLEVPKNNGYYGYYAGNASSLFFDEDKIITSNGGPTVSVLSRKDGKIKNEVDQALNVAYSITSVLADHRWLILGTSFGGIVTLDFGGSLFYWSDLKGRRLTENNQDTGDQMDDSQD